MSKGVSKLIRTMPIFDRPLNFGKGIWAAT